MQTALVASLIFILALHSQLIHQCSSAGYELNVELITYSNPDGLRADSTCCDGFSLVTLACVGYCDNLFTVCLREGGKTVDEESLCDWEGNYSPGMQQSTLPVEADMINFTNSSGDLANPLSFTTPAIPLTGLQVYVSAFDADPFGVNDKIDFFSIEVTSFDINHRNQSIITKGILNIAELELSYNLRCSNGFYGVKCSRFCVPQDNNIHGHFTCSQEGEKICLLGYMGSNCKQKVAHFTTMVVSLSSSPTSTGTGKDGQEEVIVIAVGGTIATVFIALMIAMITILVLSYSFRSYKRRRALSEASQKHVTNHDKSYALRDAAVPFSNPVYTCEKRSARYLPSDEVTSQLEHRYETLTGFPPRSSQQHTSENSSANREGASDSAEEQLYSSVHAVGVAEYEIPVSINSRPPSFLKAGHTEQLLGSMYDTPRSSSVNTPVTFEFPIAVGEYETPVAKAEIYEIPVDNTIAKSSSEHQYENIQRRH